MSAEDLLGLVQQLPPGADIFATVQQFIDNEVFPDLGQAFWVQFYLAVGLLSLVTIAIIVATVFKAKNGRLSFIVQDGSCTRIDPRFAVPLLWTVGAILQIVFSFAYRHSVRKHEYTQLMGRLWLLVYLPMSTSYVFLSAAVIAGAPPVRRYLSKTSHGLLKYNGAVILFQAAQFAGAFQPALRHGDALVNITEQYKAISKIIAEARAAQDLGALFALEEPIAALETANDEYRVASRIANGVYGLYIVVYLVTGVIPAIVLARLVCRKIHRLEDSQRASSNGFGITYNSTEQVDSPALVIELAKTQKDPAADTESLHVPEQPKDRPFAHLLDAKTTIFPSRFHTIMTARGQSSQERAKRLRAVLKNDLRMYAVYFALLIAFLALNLFFVCGGQSHLKSTKVDLSLGYAWPTWNFLVPAILLAILYVRDALSPSLDVSEAREYGDMNRISRTFRPPAVDAIQCSQVVAVTYTEQKGSTYGDKEAGHRWRDGKY